MKTLQNITIGRSGVQEYLADELYGNGSMEIIELVREPYEVKKSVDTIKDTPITINHYDNDISEVEVVGEVLNAWFDPTDSTIKANLLLFKDVEMSSLSLGYDVELVEKDNRIYQKNIKITHLSFVESARCGKMCKIN